MEERRESKEIFSYPTCFPGICVLRECPLVLEAEIMRCVAGRNVGEDLLEIGVRGKERPQEEFCSRAEGKLGEPGLRGM